MLRIVKSICLLLNALIEIHLVTQTRSFLPGQEAGNVDIVLDGEFGAFCKKPPKIAQIVTSWLQDDAKLDELSRNSAKVGNPHAASNIVLDIGRITLETMDNNYRKCT